MARTGWAHMNGLAAATWWCCCAASIPLLSLAGRPPSLASCCCCCCCYPSSRFWLSVGELSGLLLLLVMMRAPSGSGQVQPWVVAAW